MLKRLLPFLFLLLFAISASAATFVWQGDCTQATGFRIYYSPTPSGENFLIGSTLCPNQALTIPGDLPQGYYVVKAYNGTQESVASNEVLLAQYYYNSVRYDYDASGKIIYKGENTTLNADVNATTWIVTKYYYSGVQIVEIEIQTTSWTNRASGWTH